VFVAFVFFMAGKHMQRETDKAKLATDKTAQIENLQTEFSGILKNVETQLTSIKSNQALSQSQTSQIAGLQDQLSSAKGDLATLQDQLKNLQGALDGIKPTRQAEQIEDLKTRLNEAQEKLDAITNPNGNIDIAANESRYFASGALIIGLIGTPRQENVELNISGNGSGSAKNKQQSAVAGDVIDFAPDGSMACRIKVISFDILKASVKVNAACTAAKT
jgi:TolA-binding protein